EKNAVFYEMILPNNTVVPICSTVRNIVLMENKIIKVGCEIKKIDDSAIEAYNLFLSDTPAGHGADPAPKKADEQKKKETAT
ncbi:MAG: hypothetical protein ACRCUT_00610, partial [Spirochaetota bacterium]